MVNDPDCEFGLCRFKSDPSPQMTTKECTQCKLIKPLSDYYKNSRLSLGVQSHCKQCSNAGYKKSRMRSGDKWKPARTALRKAYADRFVVWRNSQKCIICEEMEGACLDLHHLDPNEKEIEISKVYKTWSWERLQTEINKCVVLCSNCHRKVHAGLISLL